MNGASAITAPQDVSQRLHLVRQQRVILDADLAQLYGVATKRLNEQYRRNLNRFPEDFAFELTRDEWAALRSQIATLKAGAVAAQTATTPSAPLLKSHIATSSLGHGGRRKLPIAFTEHGALMAANVLNSPQAVTMSVYVIRAFIKMREDQASNSAILKRLAEIDKTLLVHDAALREVFQKLQPLLAPRPAPSKREIGFHFRDPQPPRRSGKKAPRP